MFESEEMIGCHSCMNEDEFDTEKEPCKSCQGMSNYVSKKKKCVYYYEGGAFCGYKDHNCKIHGSLDAMDHHECPCDDFRGK